MTLHNANNQWPNPIIWRRYARNGLVPMAIVKKRIADHMNHALAFRKKEVIRHARVLGNIPLGSSGSTNLLRGYMRTGRNTRALWMRVGLAICDNASATDPSVSFDATPSGGGASSSNSFRYGAIDTAKNATNTDLDDISWGLCKVDVDPATFHTLVVIPDDYARLVSATIYEVGENPLDDSDTGIVNPNYVSLQQILDGDMSDLAQAMTQLWKDNPNHLLAWTADTEYTGSPFVLATTATWTNVLDGSSTTPPVASSPGYQPNLDYHNTTSQAAVPVRLAVYAERTAGAGTVANNAVRLESASGALITVTGINAAGWYTADGTLPVGETKWDIMARTDPVDTIAVYAVSCQEYLA